MTGKLQNILLLSISIVFVGLSLFVILLMKNEICTLEARVVAVEAMVATASVPDLEDLHQGGIETNLNNIEFPVHKDDFIDFSSPYGVRRSPFSGELVHHSGLDLYGTWHARIVATGSGTIIEHWIPPGQVRGFRGHDIFGGCLVIDMDDGVLMTLGHLSETYVHEGDRVAEGDIIARQGSTGRSTGEHLHVGIIIDGAECNPMKYFIGKEQE